MTSYRGLLALTGPGYVVVAFLGRLPLAMSQLGTVLLVTSATGRYAIGGLAVGALAVANALGAPVAGAFADRWGQRPVVLVQAFAAASALLALVASASAGAPAPAMIVLAALVGLVMPPVGPLARVRWRPITHFAGSSQQRLVDAAFSYEGAADEASFVLGPALVGVVAVVLDPAAALVIAAVLLAVFSGWFALHPTARLAHDLRPDRAASGGRLATTPFAVLVAALLLIGVVFGATQTGVTVLATAVGSPGMAGLVYALMGVGSAVAGLAVAGLPQTFGYERRLLVFAAGLLVLSAPLLGVGSLGALAAVVVALGVAVAPYVISGFTLAERIVPPARVGAAMTLLAGAIGVGYALGSGVAGRLADAGGATPAFAVTVSAAGLAVVLTATCRGRLAHAQSEVAREAAASAAAAPQGVAAAAAAEARA
ncbi:MAG TPA: MFS transporter [Jiangellaceae bacterium]